MSFSNTAGQPDYKPLLFLGKGDIVDGEKTDVWKRQCEILVFHKEKAWNSSLHARKLFVILAISVYMYMYFSDLLNCHPDFEKKIFSPDLWPTVRAVRCLLRTWRKEQEEDPKHKQHLPNWCWTVPDRNVCSLQLKLSCQKVCVCGETVPPTLTPSLHETGSI